MSNYHPVWAPPTPAELIQRLGLPLIIKPRTYLDKRELGWRNVVAHLAPQCTPSEVKTTS